MSDNGQQAFFPVVQKWTKWTIDYTVVHVRTWTTAIYINIYCLHLDNLVVLYGGKGV